MLVGVVKVHAMRIISPVVLIAISALSLFAQDKKPPVKDAPPKLGYAIPLSVPVGQKTRVTIRGQRLDSITEVKASDPKVTVKLMGKGRKAGSPNNYPVAKLGDTEFDFELETPKDYAGPIEITVTSPTGTSEPYKLALAIKTIAEKEPNEGFAQAQLLTLPVTVTGNINRERDVDMFQFTAKSGEKLKLEVFAARLGSPADLILTLYDADHRVIQIIDDVDGNADPILTFSVPKDGTYYAALQEVNDLGGAHFGYRFALTTLR